MNSESKASQCSSSAQVQSNFNTKENGIQILNFEQNPESPANVTMTFIISLILMYGGHDYMFLP